MQRRNLMVNSATMSSAPVAVIDAQSRTATVDVASPVGD